jgi:DNA-binding CsgD family transcriptional regulator/tetratricopeptide (TPR) repeat protein
MSTRMTSARFVGRSEQLAELDAALRDAAVGRPSLALVGGESGVGKSRLADELSHRAKSIGARVLWGDCVEIGEGELPYAPLLTALRPLVRDSDPALEELPSPLRSGLDAILPGLGAGPAEGEAAQVFEGLLALLQALGEQTAVVLVVEDLHWADSSTRHFIRFLSRAVCDERLLVLGTYRSDELHRRHPLRPLLAELGRESHVRLLELPRFTRDELGEQLEGILAGAPDPGLAERIYSRSEGNALFTEEILAAGLDGRGSLPPTLRDALMLRVERLSPRAQEVLRWLSCQPAADHELLAAVAELEPTDLRDALRETVASQIAVTLPEGSYAFRHALLREVVHDDLLPGERTDMHAALALALEARIAEGEAGAHVTAQAAHHWMAAGKQPEALRAAVRAAHAAGRVHAFGEAQALFERALALWERVPESERPVEHVELLTHAANAADQAGDPARQEALLRRALALEDDPRASAPLLERLSQAVWSLHRQDESIDILKSGLALIPDDEESPEHALLLSQLARKRMLQSRFVEAEGCALKALTIARALGDLGGEAHALNTLGFSIGGSRDPDAGVEQLRESLAVARRAGLSMEQDGAFINMADILSRAGRTAEALAVAREGLEVADSPRRSADWLRLSVSEFNFKLGNWAEAERAIPAASRRHTGGTIIYWQICRAVLALGRGDEDLAGEALDAIALAGEGLTEPQFVGPHGSLSAELARRRGDLDTARAAVDEALERIEYCSEDFVRLTSLASNALRVEGDAGETARDRRDEEAERLARTRADALLERVQLASSVGGPVERAELASAEAEHARATEGGSSALWATAAERWEELDRPYRAAYARWREAEALMATRDRDGAARAATVALEGARRMGSAWLAEEIESLALRARLRLGDEAPSPAGAEAAEAAAVENPFGLTARESEVLALVAGGATNREIGERLHMAEKTASVHVSRILAKLNVRSRTEAAAVAHRQGLAEAGTR